MCADCQLRLIKVDHQQCIICHKPSPLGMTHSGCKTPWAPDGLVSFYDYHDKKIAKLIIDGKYNLIFGIYDFLGKLVAENIKQREYQYIFSNSYLLIPIPLFKLRERWRGFNQSEILCRTLSEQLNIPTTNILTRKKFTKTQKDLKKTDRKQNVDGAFSISGKISISEGGQNFILVDDVITTGSTLLEAVKTLKRNGAGKVWCLTVARD